ncbi:bifunctional demethylmenaquinone methyltransferase/2-methoxy-6-polyprenyl-1,4-benzoquinol methylase UbiE [Raineya orbicola]|jgi:demethylmenaquinone methyltransferase/2-methoxy-6-polyprenyl-1,4-benzoquinol methylase|uniref:Demethylmenaquinone methyltransferase n=1 Tax=Raineya orbicola TaxID=2016530 RepID=A0A2N3IHK1_9BACT|nr:bifunctional demethylmenaquinone methyltransferase/2-methoxy-6-polyprenyl-1,4-benzoquinol methylase UbiE [Raineya orbicola]PKQ69774.1 Ubiquinone/menaquinone biosynthesis methyltransferase [Raineya orbicola]
METIIPYKSSQKNKKEQVAEMFDKISPTYDLLNRVLSGGIDKSWRKKALTMLQSSQPQTILDVATGTADLAILAQKMLNPQKIVGIDISEGMLALGREKIQKLGLQDKITLQTADSENLPFAESSFDAVMVSFGVRNFANLEQGLSEIYRVTKPQGKVMILEFSKPSAFPVKQLYQFYSKTFLPWLGKLISKDKAAYEYLPASVEVFPEGKNFVEILEKIGFKNVTCKPLTFGICSIYIGEKS